MRKLTFKETTLALRDPWSWCQDELRRRNMGSRELSERTGVARSTLRQLYSGSVAAPTYAVQLKIVAFLIDSRADAINLIPKHNAPALPATRFSTAVG